MDYAQVSAAVVTQEFIDGFQNDYLAEVAARYPDRFFVCGMCEFRKPGYLDQARQLIARGFQGIKIPAQRLLLQEGRVRLNGEEMMQMFHLMEQNGVLLSIDMADGDTQVGELEEVIQECPKLKWRSKERLKKLMSSFCNSGIYFSLMNQSCLCTTHCGRR